jgi:hypothetical protein
MVFSKSEDPQREWREPANEANKPGKIRKICSFAAFAFQNRLVVKR